jgi:DNA-binding beta-propeller fold protein YncE
MKSWLVGLCALLSAPALAQQPSPAPVIPFDSVANFLKMPDGKYIGEAAGVAVNSKKHVFVYTRADPNGSNFGAAASVLLEFGPDGQYIREIGHNLYSFGFAHAVRVDKQDNVWAIDKGTDMVTKFSPAGKVLMVLGRRQEASGDTVPWKTNANPPYPHENNRFRQPTDVAFDAAGDAYISDGYVNARVAKVDKDGKWLMSWGEHGDQQGQFSTAHGIAADAKGNIYVADRGNRRIQVFDGSGKFLRIIQLDVPYDANAYFPLGNPPKVTAEVAAAGGVPPGAPLGLQAPGAPWTVCITPGPNQVLYTVDAFPGRIYKLTLDGKLLGVLGAAGKRLKEFGWVHSMACPSENELYVAEVLNWRVQKLILHPEKMMPAQRTAAR